MVYSSKNRDIAGGPFVRPITYTLIHEPLNRNQLFLESKATFPPFSHFRFKNLPLSCFRLDCFWVSLKDGLGLREC